MDYERAESLVIPWYLSIAYAQGNFVMRLPMFRAIELCYAGQMGLAWVEPSHRRPRVGVVPAIGPDTSIPFPAIPFSDLLAALIVFSIMAGIF